MVDTLAPKRIFTQRELDTQLTPIEEQVKKSKPRESVINGVTKDTPSAVDTSLIDKITKDVNVRDAQNVTTAEQEQTVKSSQETQDVKQTGEQVQKDVPQGLVARPIEYAKKGYDDKEISGPIVVGEVGPEMIVPTGDGKISILPTKIVEGLMVKPLKEAEKGMYDVKYAQEGLDNVYTGGGKGPRRQTNPASERGLLGNPAGNPRHQSNIMNKSRYYTDESRQQNKWISMDQGYDINNRGPYGNLISKDNENQHRDEFATTSIIAGLMSGESQDVYSGTGVTGVIDVNWGEVIQPIIYQNTQLSEHLPSNIQGTDISGSLRDSYTHSYTGGYYNLVKGEATAKDIGSYGAELVIGSGQKAVPYDPQVPLSGKPVPGKDNTTFGTGKTLGTSLPNPFGVEAPDADRIKDAMMDVNNNMVGNSIANEVRKELGLGTGALKGEDLIAAETLFQEKHTEMYFTELSKYAAGDNLIPEYETTPSTEEIKERIYGEGGGLIKNRLKGLMEKYITGVKEDSDRHRLIIKYNPEGIAAHRKEIFDWSKPLTPPGVAARKNN